MWDNGYSFDFVSDRMLEQAIEVSGQQLQSRGGAYQALLVVGCRVIPPQTMQRIVDLARAGATVLIVGDLPQDVPGLGSLTERREQLGALRSELGAGSVTAWGGREVRLDKGRLLIGANVQTMVQAVDIRRESMVDAGIEFVRRRDDDGYLYFLVNLGECLRRRCRQNGE